MMSRDRLSSRIRVIPAVQVHNLIQQSIRGGPMSHKSRLGSSRNSQHKTGARSKNPVVHRVQTTLAGENLAAKDNDSFGHEFPTQPTLNSSIITF